MSATKLDDLTNGTRIELIWPPSGQWQTGTITHVWGNGEFAIQFEDDPFDEPLTYRLESYEWRLLSSPTKSKDILQLGPTMNFSDDDEESDVLKYFCPHCNDGFATGIALGGHISNIHINKANKASSSNNDGGSHDYKQKTNDCAFTMDAFATNEDDEQDDEDWDDDDIDDDALERYRRDVEARYSRRVSVSMDQHISILDGLMKKYGTYNEDDDENMNVNKDNDGIQDKHINYLKLDDYMINIDDESLNKLNTAQLMQRLKSHNLPFNGLKHELIERWKTYKLNCN